MIGMAYTFQGHMTEVAADGSLLPHLAESREASADAATWSFRLRKGVEFHSGKLLTADDVIASINHHRGEGAKSAAAPLVSAIRDIRADGPDTVVFELDGGNADFPFVLSDYHLCIGPAKDGKVDWAAGDACGPYRIENFEPDVQAQLTRHANCWREDRAHFDGVEMLSLVDPTARMSALLQGKVDAIDRVDLKTVDRLKAAPGINVHSVAGTKHYSFAMSCNKPPFTAVYRAGRPVEDQMLATAYETGAAWNDTFWSNARFDELLLKARAELDEEKRRAMYYEMQEIVHNDGGVIVPMFASYVFATSDKVAYADTFGSTWDLDGERWAERWWFA